MEPKIIFENEEILVLDKPAGITVNRADTTRNEVTVQDRVEGYLQISNLIRQPADQISKYEGNPSEQNKLDFLGRAGIVHRLDKETSGILLVAKTLAAFENLQKQFKERIVKKTYTALVHGKVVPEDGEVNVPVGRLPWDRMKFGVIAGGKEAVTKYHVLSIMYQVLDKTKEDYTLLELYPKTGRTHQIRVHLKYLGYPIFSDPLYAGRKQMKKDRKILSRIFLHASKISFLDPKTNKELSFEAPLPQELEEFLGKLTKV
ncbi:RluA family pseudouridine synthase [Candidatus Microgenomates bacterium]|nr:MAG: RluA family pseudouridine synthase [Candidatus Microgenomates bacterium]